MRRRGSIMIVTLWIVFVLAGLVLVFARAMRVEALASANGMAGIQAAAVERGAEQYVLGLIDQQKDQVLMLSEDSFQAVQIGEGMFWIIRPDYGDSEMPSFGLVDEASKINLNWAAQPVLEKVPNMSADLPPSIIDWRDIDEDITAGGGESESYSSLGYTCKNGPLETVEELLLVRGCTRGLLYGTNYRADQSSDRGGKAGPNDAMAGGGSSMSQGAQSSGTASVPAYNPQWQLAHGVYEYFTVYSSEPNTSSSGQARIYINDQNTQSLRNLLQQTIGAARAAAIAARLGPIPPFRNIFEFQARTGLTAAEFGQIADRLTSSTAKTQRGLININTACRDVLMCLPGLDESDVVAIVSRRAGTGSVSTDIGWVAEALPSKVVAIGELITGRAYQYSAEIVAVSGNGRSFKRCRIVVDASSSPPRIVYRRDLTREGWPLDPAILASLREGTFGASTNITASGGDR